MKYLCLLAVLLTLPVTATAQQRPREGRGDERRSNDRGSSDRNSNERGQRDRDRDRSSDDRKPDRPGTRAGFNPTVPSWEQKTSPWWERQGTPWWERGHTAKPAFVPTRNNRHDEYRYRRNNNGVIYVVPSYPIVEETVTTVVTPPPPSSVITRAVPPPPPPVPIGFLNLEVEPRALLQIYVDDVFVGTPVDLGDELRLAAGTRRIELRARGYKTLTFSAEVVENRSINYRGALERDPTAVTPSEPAAVRPPVSTGPTTMYMVPGCYLGNVAPKATELRPGCDIARLVTFKP